MSNKKAFSNCPPFLSAVLADEKLHIEKRLLFLARSVAKMEEKLTGNGRADAARRNIFRREEAVNAEIFRIALDDGHVLLASQSDALIVAPHSDPTQPIHPIHI